MKFMYWKSNKKETVWIIDINFVSIHSSNMWISCIKIICLEIIICYQKASINTECFSLADHLVPQVWQYYPNPMQPVLTSGFWANQVIIILLTHKALHQQSPIYVQDLICGYWMSRRLLSSSTLHLNPVSFNLSLMA